MFLLVALRAHKQPYARLRSDKRRNGSAAAPKLLHRMELASTCALAGVSSAFLAAASAPPSNWARSDWVIVCGSVVVTLEVLVAFSGLYMIRHLRSAYLEYA